MPVTSVLLVAPDRALRAESLQKTLQPHRSAPHTTTSHMLPSTCSACAQTQGTGTPHQAHTGRAHQDNRRLRCSPGELAGPPDSREQCLHTRGHTHVTQNQLCTHVLRGRESQLGKVSRGGSAPSPHNSLQPPHTHTRTHTVTCKCHSSLTSSPTVVLKGGKVCLYTTSCLSPLGRGNGRESSDLQGSKGPRPGWLRVSPERRSGSGLQGVVRGGWLLLRARPSPPQRTRRASRCVQSREGPAARIGHPPPATQAHPPPLGPRVPPRCQSLQQAEASPTGGLGGCGLGGQDFWVIRGTFPRQPLLKSPGNAPSSTPGNTA